MSFYSFIDTNVIAFSLVELQQVRGFHNFNSRCCSNNGCEHAVNTICGPRVYTCTSLISSSQVKFHNSSNFRYLKLWSTEARYRILTVSARGPGSDVTQILTSEVDPRTERIKHLYGRRPIT